MCRNIYTPQDYKEALEEAFPKKQVEVKYLFACPDYVNFLADYIDPKLAYFAKVENTKLRFSFSKVSNDMRYPCKAGFTYKAFCADKVLAVIDKSLIPEGKLNEHGRNVGHQCIEIEVEEQPRNSLSKLLFKRHALVSMPAKTIRPAPIVKGSRSALDDVLEYIAIKFKKESKEYKAWSTWATDNAPESDDVQQYLSKSRTPENALFPLSFDKLFIKPGTGGVLPMDPIAWISKPIQRNCRVGLLKAIATDSLRTSDNPDYIPPFVWKDTLEPVYPKQTRKRNAAVAEIDTENLLHDRDFKDMRNSDLQELITKINSKYGLNVKTKGNKTSLVEQVEDAIMLATLVQGLVGEDENNELRESDSASENDNGDNDSRDDEDGDSATDND